MREPTPNLNKALSQLQGELPKVTKSQDGKVTYEGKEGRPGGSYSYKYADLADVTAAVGPLLAKYGLAFHAAPTIDPADRNEMILAWTLAHESGEERSGEYPLGQRRQKPQSLGSMITYARRYSLGAATGIVAEEDDDGNRAQQEHGNRQSAGNAFENAAPARPSRQDSGGNGHQREQPSRPPGETAPYPSAQMAADEGAIDEDAQTLADKASQATLPREIEDIHRRAREEKKVTLPVRNPSSGGIGKLAVYLDWRRKQLERAIRLEPEDPWALKIEEIPEGDNTAAAAVLSELCSMLDKGEIDTEHAGRVENTVLDKFPGAAHVEDAAA
jgi:hypothetical protein